MIRCVQRNFVPVAVNLYKARNAKDAGGDLFRSVQRQKDQYQGIWIVAPGGRVLAGHHDVQNHETWSQQVLATADAALKSFGTVEPREWTPTNPLPFRGWGVQPDGSVCLSVYARQMMGGGKAFAPSSVPQSRLWVWDGDLRRDGPVVIDSLTLPAKQWSAFQPPKTEVGTTWSIPEEVSRRFCRVLVPSSDQSAMPLPEDAKVARMTATLDSAENGRMTVRISGVFDALHLIEGDSTRPIRGVANAEGVLTYDSSQRELQSLLIVFHGAYGRPEDGSANECGGVVEWHRSRPVAE